MTDIFVFLRRSRVWLALVMIASASATSIHAQGAAADSIDATEGSRVRLSARTLQNPSVTGTLTTVRGDSLWLRYAPSSAPTPFARSALTRLEVSGGHPGRTRSAWIGGLIGFAGGAVLGVALGSGGSCTDGCKEPDVRLPAAAITGAFFGFVGVLVGSVTVGPERWYPGRLTSTGPNGGTDR
jgi:hypothetical protein